MDADGAVEALSTAIESGAGLPAVSRAAARALDASVALIDRSSAVLAVAAESSDEESKLLAGGDAVNVLDLRVADEPVGELRWRARSGEEPGAGDAAHGRDAARARAGALALAGVGERGGRGGLRALPAGPAGDRPRGHRGAGRGARGGHLAPAPAC